MAQEYRRFSEEVEQRLRWASWYPGRQLEEAVLERWLAFKWGVSPGYCMMFPSALRVLREFGGLSFFQGDPWPSELPRPDNAAPIALNPIYTRRPEFWPTTAQWLRIQWHIEEHLYPLGTYGDCDVLAITPRGHVYSFEHGTMIHGLSFDSALEHLLTGHLYLGEEQLIHPEESADLVIQAVEGILPSIPD